MFLPDNVVPEILLSACMFVAYTVPSISIALVCNVSAVRVLKIPPAVLLMFDADTVRALTRNISLPETAVLAKSLKSVT